MALDGGDTDVYLNGIHDLGSSVYSMLQLLHVLQRSTRMPRPTISILIGLSGIFNNIKSRSDTEVKTNPAPVRQVHAGEQTMCEIAGWPPTMHSSWCSGLVSPQTIQVDPGAFQISSMFSS